jgi:antitoxin component YwqK of YwqJK toxin-antitoxin module
MKLSPVFIVSVIVAGGLAVTGCNSPETSYWPDGKVKSEIPYNAAGRIDGIARWYYQDGQPQVEAVYMNGVLNGHLYRWQENGVKLYEGHYSDGKLEGKSIEWDFAGIKIKEQTYKNGELNGLSTEWYPSGPKLSEGEYKEGFMQGQWLFWDIGGNIMGRADFNHGTGYKSVISPMGKEVGKSYYLNNVEQQ